MRIRRLDLLKYGHFTNAGFDLPDHQPDFHMIFGLNEAGKSTALSAIEDLLFGIPHNSPLNFVHDYASMRLGALIESEARTLAVRRRKGNRDTLLTGDDAYAGRGGGARDVPWRRRPPVFRADVFPRPRPPPAGRPRNP
jgi:uncharacterized protein YhaN